jgi:peptide/nickel transport system permease protein
MLRSLINRILQALIVLFGVALLVFILLRVIPGNPIAAMMGEHADAAVIERMTKELGLDRPIPVQFLHYVSSALRGDFGTSYSLGRPVSALMAGALLNTLKLTLLSVLFSWSLGIVCGVAAAVRKNSFADRLFMGTSLLGVSMPVFMVAMLLQYVFAYHFHFLPISGSDDWRCFILPAIALGWNSAGSVSRLVRSTLLEILQEDYIDTARAKGGSRSFVLVRHALQNAMLPVVTIMAIQASSLLSGAVITETIFSINGIGRLAVQAISGRDIPLIQGTTLFATLMVILGNLIADSLYSVLDPRIRREA